ncbi:MAG: hypothetical protein LBU77_02185, partial [Clostridiales bacterium]|nr:hypothetical protein [Clostridiales bacterium]
MLLLLAFLLLLLLIALTAPIRYEFKAAKNGELSARLRLTWLFGAVRFRFVYENGQSETGLFALWFQLQGK